MRNVSENRKSNYKQLENMSNSPFYKTGVSRSPLNQTLPELTKTNNSSVNVSTHVTSGTTDFKDIESRKGNNKSITAEGLMEAASYVPVIGTAAQAGIVANKASKGNFKDAAMASLFVIPGTKAVKGVSKLIKTGVKALKAPKQLTKAGAKITSKKDPRYYKPDRKFSDTKGDGSLRVDPMPKKPTVLKETKYTSIDKGKTKREGYFGMSNKPLDQNIQNYKTINGKKYKVFLTNTER